MNYEELYKAEKEKSAIYLCVLKIIKILLHNEELNTFIDKMIKVADK